MTRRSVFPDRVTAGGRAAETAGAETVVVIAGVDGPADRDSGRGLVSTADGFSTDGAGTIFACGVDSPVFTGETEFPD